MMLHSPAYFVLLLLSVLLSRRLSQRPRKLVLLGLSLAFYASFDFRYPLLLLGLALITYLLARRIERQRQARVSALLSVAISLGLLIYFKYLPLIQQGLLGPSAPPPEGLLLPVGISFYVFQVIGCTIDLLRRRLVCCPPLTDYLLLLVYFPRLLAGPLVSNREFLDQLSRPAASPEPGADQASYLLLLRGAVKKIVLADGLASLAEVAFATADLSPAVPIPAPLYWQGFFLYAIQIYADFSGYTDLARGSAALLGFRLPENFNRPYAAHSITDFWNRWHMSLTRWFREYFFYPLTRALIRRRGSNAIVQVLVNAATMLLIGTWHGAGWTYLVWGGWHALLLTLEKAAPRRAEGRWPRWIAQPVTFLLVSLGWVIFRSTDLTSAWFFFQGMFSGFGWRWSAEFLPAVILSFGLLGVLEASFWQPGSAGRTRAQLEVALIASLLLIGALMLLRLAAQADLPAFIYAQF